MFQSVENDTYSSEITDDMAVKPEAILLDVDTTSLLTLTQLNANNLAQQHAVDETFIEEVITSPALPLVGGIWLTDALVANQKNALAFSRAKNVFHNNGKAVLGVLTISAIDDQINSLLSRLLTPEVQNALLFGDMHDILNALNGNLSPIFQPQSAVKNKQNLQTDLGEE